MNLGQGVIPGRTALSELYLLASLESRCVLLKEFQISEQGLKSPWGGQMTMPNTLPTALGVRRGSSWRCRRRPLKPLPQFQDRSAGEQTVRDSDDRGHSAPLTQQAAGDPLQGVPGRATRPQVLRSLPLRPLKSFPNEVMHTTAETHRQTEDLPCTLSTGTSDRTTPPAASPKLAFL